MYDLKKFGERLKELMEERALTAPALAAKLNTDRTNITRYIKGERAPLFNNFISLAEFFDCSADYLLGLTDYPPENTRFTAPPPFGERLKEVIKFCGLTQYKLEKSGEFSSSELFNWVSGKKLPSVESLVKLATFMKCSVDFLLGRLK